jgi:hypothetical protein
LGESLLEKMEIGESFSGKKKGKLALGKYITPKIFPDLEVNKLYIF